MITGGALGNVFDRISNKAVPDFIDFHVGNFHWFIFNIADIFITIGVFLMILLELIDNNKEGMINRCVECNIDMGRSNPRQLCGKTFCCSEEN